VVHITVALTAPAPHQHGPDQHLDVNTDPTITAHAAVVVSPVRWSRRAGPTGPPIDPSARRVRPDGRGRDGTGSSLAFTGFDPTGIAEVAALLLGAGTAVLASPRRRCRAGAGRRPDAPVVLERQRRTMAPSATWTVTVEPSR